MKIEKLDIIKIKSLHERVISERDFEALKRNMNVKYTEKSFYEKNLHFIFTVDGDDFEVIVEG